MSDNLAIKMCTNCNERPVEIKKAGLCKRCYGRKRSGHNMDAPFRRPTKKCENDIFQHEREHLFALHYFGGRPYVYHPCAFYLSNGRHYTPDFYDVDMNVFIEVVGSRQAYYQQKDRGTYDLFFKTYPHLVLEIRASDGHLLIETPGIRKNGHNNTRINLGREVVDLAALNALNPYKIEVVGKYKSTSVAYIGTRNERKLTSDQVKLIRQDDRSLSAIGREYGVPAMCISRIRNGITYNWVE